MFKVNIIYIETSEVVESFNCTSYAEALRVEKGASINLNHDKYFTLIEEEE